MVTSNFSPRELRDAFGRFATGVTVITAVKPDGQPVGITANSFTSVSLDPPLVLWCIARSSPSVSAFSENAAFAVTILGVSERETALHFAGRASSKFPSGATIAPDRAPAVPGANLCRIDCVVERLSEAGDHFIVLGRVQAIDLSIGEPLAFHGGKFGRFLSDARAAELDIWEAGGVEMPRYLRTPFE